MRTSRLLPAIYLGLALILSLLGPLSHWGVSRAQAHEAQIEPVASALLSIPQAQAGTGIVRVALAGIKLIWKNNGETIPMIPGKRMAVKRIFNLFNIQARLLSAQDSLLPGRPPQRADLFGQRLDQPGDIGCRRLV